MMVRSHFVHNLKKVTKVEKFIELPRKVGENLLSSFPVISRSFIPEGPMKEKIWGFSKNFQFFSNIFSPKILPKVQKGLWQLVVGRQTHYGFMLTPSHPHARQCVRLC